MNLRNRNVESVATYLALQGEPDNAANDIVALEPSLATADETAAKLRVLAQVARVTTLSTFIPTQQDQKLPLIQTAAETLEPALSPDKVSPPPTDAENIAIINSTVAALNKFAGDAPGPGADAAKRLAAAMDTLAKGDQAARQRADVAFVQPLKVELDNLRHLLKAQPVTRENLPPELVNQWITKDGLARLEVMPSGNENDNTTLRTFARDVQNVEPNATEGPISILEARRTIITAFLEAAAWALLSIAVLLWITLRRLGDVLLTLIPLLVAGVVTLEICVLIDMPLNFANIIALPLLLGVGVAFKIYYIMAWREGQTRLLQSVLTRAVTFSALHHGDRVRQPLLFQRPRDLEHGQAARHLAADDDDGGGVLSAGADGQAARENLWRSTNGSSGLPLFRIDAARLRRFGKNSAIASESQSSRAPACRGRTPSTVLPLGGVFLGARLAACAPWPPAGWD